MLNAPGSKRRTTFEGDLVTRRIGVYATESLANILSSNYTFEAGTGPDTASIADDFLPSAGKSCP